MNERFFTLPLEKQQAIINAGYRVFSQNSYKNSPMSEIADAAGISKSLLFHYFRNKKELYLFLWDKCAETTIEYLTRYAIRITDLTKYYGKARGITHLNLTVENGEFFGFIGPNGAGKSTTIRTLLGLISPTDGNAQILGMDIVKDKQAILSKVGYLPSEAVFYPGMWVKDVLKLSADLHHKDCCAEANMLCERLQLDMSRKADELSFFHLSEEAGHCRRSYQYAVHHHRQNVVSRLLEISGEQCCFLLRCVQKGKCIGDFLKHPTHKLQIKPHTGEPLIPGCSSSGSSRPSVPC